MEGDSTPEGEQPAAGGKSSFRFKLPGAVQLIDALLGILQRLRNRLGASGEAIELPEEGNKKPRAERTAKDAPLELPKEPAQPATPVRIFFIFIMALILGGLGGMAFSYTLFATTIETQSEKLSELHDDIAIMERDNERIQQSCADARIDLTETQKKLVETQRDLSLVTSFSKNKCGETGFEQSMRSASKAAAASASRASQRSSGNGASLAASAGAAKPATAKQAPGSCDIGSGSPSENLSRCLSDFNRTNK